MTKIKFYPDIQLSEYIGEKMDNIFVLRSTEVTGDFSLHRFPIIPGRKYAKYALG